jgi:glycosyltransferase involved in cell wall biosynthesis
LSLSSRLSIAHFSPLPPQRSGIAVYCAELLPRLAAEMRVDAYVDAPAANDSTLARSLDIRSIADFLASPDLRKRYHVCLYHMGNHPAYHEPIYSALLRYPGVTVLHELDLHAFYLTRSGPAVYVREMGYACGLDGARRARLVSAGKLDTSNDLPPLFNRIADVSLGLIVHTEYARQRILAESPRARVAYIPLAASLPSSSAPTGKPGLFEAFPPGVIVLASFGYVAPSKRIEVVLRALAQLRNEMSNVRYILVGEQVPGCNFGPLIEELGLTDIVHLTGFVDDAAFQVYLNTIDIGINLRTGPTGGEMSATLVRLLASSRPTIVSDVGGFAALPDKCVVKLRQDTSEVEQLVAALRYLAANPHGRAAYGEAARQYVQRECSFESVAHRYTAFIRECLDSIVDKLPE